MGSRVRQVAFWKLEDWRFRALAGLVAGIVVVAARNAGVIYPAGDLFTYWHVDPANPFVRSTVGLGWSYLYSPAFAQAIEPARHIPWPVVEVSYTVLLTALLVGGAGWFGIIAFALPGVGGEIMVGNIDIVLGAAIAVGLRESAAWAFVLLTKVTPGIGLMWFAARHEWRALSLALGATGAIVAISLALNANLWTQWVGVLSANRHASDVYSVIPIPLPLRLAIAGIVVAVAARRDWAWVVPGACAFALPILWPGAFAMALFGIVLLPKQAHVMSVAPVPGTDPRPQLQPVASASTTELQPTR